MNGIYICEEKEREAKQGEGKRERERERERERREGTVGLLKPYECGIVKEAKRDTGSEAKRRERNIEPVISVKAMFSLHDALLEWL